MGEACSTHARDEKKIENFGRKCEGKRPRGRRRRRLEDNIKMELREIGWKFEDWIYLAQYRNQSRGLLNTVMKFCIP
jgi:hypothetical protein